MRTHAAFLLVTGLALAACAGSGAGSSTGQSSSGSAPSPEGVSDSGFPLITVDGGTLAELVFAVVGDTRPLNPDDTSGYPVGTINAIYGALKLVNPAPQFIIGTGDYQYVTPGSGQSAAQVGKYLAAAALYPAALLAAMGNHECTGYTDSECGPNGADGETENYKTFLALMAAPLGATTAYYSVPLKAADGAWTAKVVCVAANAWDSAQATWLAGVLAQPTTYTFLVHHEPSDETKKLPALTQINALVAAAPTPITLRLVGHSHTFRMGYGAANEVIVGNGGVPQTTGSFGFALVSRESSGNLRLTQYDELSGAPTPGGVSFAVTATGQPAN